MNTRHRQPVRIGIMLRSLDERGGVGIYTRGILRELLELDDRNEYTLYYRDSSNLGRYADRPNVRERAIKGRFNGMWDQFAIPPAARKDGVDVLFHPKFTVPVWAPCPTVMVLHGADWLLPEQAQYYPRRNVSAMKILVPLWCRRASAILSVSELTTQNIIAAVDGLPAEKVTTTYFAPARNFARVESPQRLDEVRRRYDLPEKFIFSLSRHDNAHRKNAEGLIAGFRHAAEDIEHELIIGGRDCDRYRQDYDIPNDGWGSRVRFLGWIEQEDLPAIYSMASLYLYPSNLEAFPIPITEAMACGTPIVTSNVNGLEELAGDAALKVPPDDPAAIGAAVQRVVEDEELAARLSAAGLARSARFDWGSCAEKTLEVLLRVARTPASRTT